LSGRTMVFVGRRKSVVMVKKWRRRKPSPI
jgi:hypothetical protein